MIKKVYIVRHAKAAELTNDYERPLTEAGLSRTSGLGEELQRIGTRLDAVYASAALRTRQTAERLAEVLDFPADKIVYDEKLYLSTEEAYFDILVGLEEEVHEVMLVGHNPEVSNLLHFFLPDFTSFMQTGACACIEFDADSWQSIFTAPHQLKFYYKA